MTCQFIQGADLVEVQCGVKEFGAGDGIRTRNPQLGKLMRYRCATPAQVEVMKIIKVLPGCQRVSDQIRFHEILPAALRFENQLHHFPYCAVASRGVRHVMRVFASLGSSISDSDSQT